MSFNVTAPTRPHPKQNNSEITTVDNGKLHFPPHLFPLLVLRGFTSVSDLKQTKQLSGIFYLMGFLVARNWRLKNVHEISLQ